jgi:peptidoglycan/xylan/chitin deacetylase (PgdA/CDA1 family)
MRDIALTFDNGPHPEVTPQVLDILAGRGIKASFFVLGKRLADPRGLALATRARDEGHWIGNHTYSHDAPLGLSNDPEAPEREIGRTQALIGALSHPDRLFRPTGGGGEIGRHLLSPAALRYLEQGRYSCVLWSAVPRDWEQVETWPERAMTQIRSRPWSLLVLHDLPSGAMAQLERFIDMAAAAGARFRQDFPPDCVPLRRGRATMPMTPYVAAREVTTS